MTASSRRPRACSAAMSASSLRRHPLLDRALERPGVHQAVAGGTVLEDVAGRDGGELLAQLIVIACAQEGVGRDQGPDAGAGDDGELRPVAGLGHAGEQPGRIGAVGAAARHGEPRPIRLRQQAREFILGIAPGPGVRDARNDRSGLVLERECRPCRLRVGLGRRTGAGRALGGGPVLLQLLGNLLGGSLRSGPRPPPATARTAAAPPGMPQWSSRRPRCCRRYRSMRAWSEQVLFQDADETKRPANEMPATLCHERDTRPQPADTPCGHDRQHRGSARAPLLRQLPRMLEKDRPAPVNSGAVPPARCRSRCCSCPGPAKRRRPGCGSIGRSRPHIGCRPTR